MSTARQVITRSLRLIGVLAAEEAGDSAEAVDALAVLNAMLESWGLSRLMILAGQTQAYPLTSDYTYSIGPGQTFDSVRVASLVDASFLRFQGIDRPLTLIDQEDYAGIVNKFVPGIPAYLYFDPSASGGEITLFPGPQTGMELHLAVNLPFTQFADLDTDYLLPPGYLRALQYNLAIELAPEYGKEASPSVQRIAQTSVRQIKKANSSVPVMGMPYGIPGTGGGRGAYGGVLDGPDFVYDIADQGGDFLQDQQP